MRRVFVIIGSVLLATGCIAPLDSPTIVKTPRILAIVAEPPEAAPGADFAFRAMISVPENVPRPLSLRWYRCLSPGRILSEAGLFVRLPSEIEAMFPCPDPVVLDPAEPFVVPGAESQRIVELIEAAASVGSFDTAVLEQILATAGLPFVVDVEVLDANGVVVVSGYKRAAFTTRASPTTNPPRPVFVIDERWAIVGSDDGSFACRSLDGTAPSLEPDVNVVIDPRFEPGEDGAETWLETFPIYDYTGGVREARENAYYSWFATAGAFSAAITRPPDRQVIWRTPAEPGPATLWLVVRDGHLGVSACRLELEITPS